MEWTTIYQDFGAVAEKEGFRDVSTAFKMIAKVELEHEKRYRALLDNVRAGRVFKKEKAVRWVCRNCGFVHEGPEAPATCAACQHPQAYFELKSENY
jgi:rubrerythrin